MQWGIRSGRRSALCAAALVAFWGASTTTAISQQQTAAAPRPAVGGQTALEAKSTLRARQSALFEQLRQDPANLDLMFAYAEVSARLEDYEAAISTLERMLIYDPNLARVRLELGALYFKIGSYEASKRYFESVAALENVPPGVRGRVDAYLVEIEKRSRRHRFSGSVGAGLVYSSNANLGPDDARVLFAGTEATLNSEFVASDDIGARGFIRLRHEYDFQNTRDDHWRTDLSAFGLRYDETKPGDVGAVTIRTGPRLSLDDKLYGPKIRPFIEGSYLNVGRDALYRAGAVGFELQQVVADQWFAFGEFRAQYRDYYSPRNRKDGWTGRGVAGVAFAPTRDIAFKLTADVEREDARVDHEKSWEGGLRVTGSFDYAPGLEFVDKKWSLSGFARVAYRKFDAADFVVDPNKRRQDFDYSIGIAHTFNLQKGWAVTIDADYLYRDSNLVNFDLDSTNVGISISYSF